MMLSSISYPATLTRKSHILFRWAAFSRVPIGRLNPPSNYILLCNPIRMNNSFASYGGRTSLTSANGFRVFGSPQIGFRQLGSRSLRVSSGSGGSGGGAGDGFGSSGGGGGSSGGGNSGSSWPFLSWYISLLAKYPVMTKAITSAFLTLVGDLVCQLAIEKVPSLDLKRTFNFTLLGLVLVGPTFHAWYLHLSKLVTATGASSAIIRLLLDQFLFAPVFIGICLSTLVTLEGRPSYVIPKLQQVWFSTVLTNWKLWIPFQFFNFRFVPQQFQVLAANFISLIWNVILSHNAHK